MRAPLFVVVLGLSLSFAAEADLPQARAMLFQGDVAAADDALADVIASPPTTDDAEAHALRSISRILRAVQAGEAGPDPGAVDSIGELLDAFGFGAAGRDLLGWSSSPPRDAQGRLDLPADSPTGGDAANVLDLSLLSAISGALDDLAALEPGFSMVVSAGEVQQFAIAYGDAGAPLGSDLEIGYADARLYEAALGAAAATILVSLAYDFDFDLDQLLDPDVAHDLQQILDADPSLLTLQPDAEALLETARQEALGAIEAYMDASERIRARTFGEGLFHLQPEDVARESSLRAELLAISASLGGCFELPIRSYGFKPCTWLGTGTRVAPDPRALLPSFAYDPAFHPQNSARVDTLPDASFGGVLIRATNADLVRLSNRLLRMPNDRWQDAIAIGDGVVEGTLELATPDGSTSLEYGYYFYFGPNDDVWYRYTANTATVLQITDCSGGSESQRNLISVHSDGPGTILNELAAARFIYSPNLDACGIVPGPIEVPLAAGQSALIRVANDPSYLQFTATTVETFSFRVPEPELGMSGFVALAALAVLARRRA
jgi:hypothetical protein